MLGAKTNQRHSNYLRKDRSLAAEDTLLRARCRSLDAARVSVAHLEKKGVARALKTCVGGRTSKTRQGLGSDSKHGHCIYVQMVPKIKR